MAWTPEDRRRYAPAIQEVVRQGMLVRLAAMIDTIHPPSSVGRPRVWPTLAILRALWHVARDDRAWRRLPPGSPPHQTVWSRLMSWRCQAVLDRALRVLVVCRRLAAGRKRRPTAAIVDTQSVRTGPQRGPRGYDANKKVKGRKRVPMVDTQGDPLGVQVVSADGADQRGGDAVGLQEGSRVVAGEGAIQPDQEQGRMPVEIGGEGMERVAVLHVGRHDLYA